jgi:hypothetical protein
MVFNATFKLALNTLAPPPPPFSFFYKCANRMIICVRYGFLAVHGGCPYLSRCTLTQISIV